MSTCKVISHAVGKGCLLWPMCFLDKTLVSLFPASCCIPRPNLPFFPGTCQLPTSAFQSPMMKRTSVFGVSSKRSCMSSWNNSTSASSALVVGAYLDYYDVEWFSLQINRDHSAIFEIVPKYCILDCFVDYEGYSIPSKGFLSTVVDAMSSELNLPIPIHFSSLIPKTAMFTLAISYLNTSSVPWFKGLTFRVSMQYCSLQHQSLLSPPDTFTTKCCFLFGSAASFFLELLFLSLCSSPVAYWIPSDLGGIIFWCLIFLPFHIVHGGSPGNNTGVVCHFLLQWTTFCQNSSLWPIHLG